MWLESLSFNHLGLAVRDDREALSMLKGLGYSIGERIHDPLQSIFVRLCTSHSHPTIEIVQPTVEGKSPIDNIISKYNELIYHICYETPDLASTLDSLDKEGLRCITLSDRKPAVLFGGRHVSFYRIAGWGIVELLETK